MEKRPFEQRRNKYEQNSLYRACCSEEISSNPDEIDTEVAVVDLEAVSCEILGSVERPLKTHEDDEKDHYYKVRGTQRLERGDRMIQVTWLSQIGLSSVPCR
jgi:hypothetical protein